MHPLVPFKKFCHTCGEDAVECNCCHRPLPSHLVENGICRTCKNKQHRVEQIGLTGAVSTYTLPISSSDPLVSLTDAQERIHEELVNRLAEHMSIY